MKTFRVAEINTTGGKEVKPMRVGSLIEIKKCETMPEMVGERGEIVWLQIQEFEKYTVYPVWAKILSGEREGRMFGFKYDEVEVLPEVPLEKASEVAIPIRVGSVIEITRCEAMPEVVGERGEVVRLQTQEFEKYTVYPVWAKILSGARKGKMFGFQYDEVKVLPQVPMEKLLRARVIDQLEEILKRIPSVSTGRGHGVTKIGLVEQLQENLRTMRTGRLVKVKKCDSMPNLVGAQAEIVELQMQEFEKYTVYPVWAKMLSGERKGKIYGFQYDEVEILPTKPATEKSAKTKLDQQLEDILRNATTFEDLAEIEAAITEVKGKILAEETAGFWKDKTPCWEMVRCPETIRNECAAYKHQGLPCWQIEGTYAKLDNYGAKGNCTDICRVCRVYKRWGHGEPIEIKLAGQGFNTKIAVK